MCYTDPQECLPDEGIIPSWYQNKLRSELHSAAKAANRKLNEVFGINHNEVLYVQLSIAPNELDQVKDKETYLSRTSDQIHNWTNLTIENLFDPIPGSDESPRSIILLSGPGMGTTTATQARASNWGRSELNLSTQTIYRFECRTFRTLVKDKTEISLVQLLFDKHNPQVASPEERAKIMAALDSSRTEIIMDGLDELEDVEELFTDGTYISDVKAPTTIPNLLRNLMNGNLLPSARFLFSTRPNSKINLRDFDRVVLGLGFTNDSIKKCIEILCQHDQSKIEQVLAHLEKTNLKVHCYVPLTCVLITMVMLNDIDNNTLDKNESSLNTFTHLYIRVIKQLLWKAKGEERLTEYNPKTKHLDGLKRLADLAAQGMLDEHRRIIFDNQHFIDKNITDSDISIGLLEVVTEQGTFLTEGSGTNITGSFLHLSLQEFMTAVHLIRTWRQEDWEFIHENVKSGRFDMVLQFTAGLLGDREFGHSFLATVDSSLTPSVLQKRRGDPKKPSIRHKFAVMFTSEKTTSFLQLLTTMFGGAELRSSKSSQLQQLLCLSEGKLGPLLEDGLPKTTLDLSNLVGGLLPYQIVAVGYHIIEVIKLTYLKYVLHCLYTFILGLFQWHNCYKIVRAKFIII